MSYPEGQVLFLLIFPGALVFALCTYSFLVWRERKDALLRQKTPLGKMSAYRGALPESNQTKGTAPAQVNLAAIGALAFSFLVPVELLVDRAGALIAKSVSRRGAAPLPFVPAWRVALSLLQRTRGGEDSVERQHRLQVLVNFVLLAALGLSAHALSGVPLVFALLSVLLVVRALHTRLLGKVARKLAEQGTGEMAAADVEQVAQKDVPPWLSRALTRRAENRLGAVPLGAARVRVAAEKPKLTAAEMPSITAPVKELVNELLEEAAQAEAAEEEKLRRARRHSGE